MEWNGMKWNGMEWNEMKWNGMGLHRIPDPGSGFNIFENAHSHGCLNKYIWQLASV
jgi:hypothetical protein